MGWFGGHVITCLDCVGLVCVGLSGGWLSIQETKGKLLTFHSGKLTFRHIQKQHLLSILGRLLLDLHTED